MQPGSKHSLKFGAAIIAVLGIAFCFWFMGGRPTIAATGINQQLNFQGRLLDNTGSVVADGNYNMEFTIVQDGDGCNPTSGTYPCSGTVKWTEDWIQTNRVTVKNGYFSVNLGSLTAFGANVNWNSDTNWLSINIGGTANTPSPSWDGAMKPMKRLTSTPYALNSNALQGLQAASFVQLAQGVQADSSTTNPSIFINKTNASGTPNILELQKSNSDVLVLDNGGGLAVTPTTASAAISLGSASETGQITVGQSTANNTISIGGAAGNGNTQAINIGTSSTTGSTTNVTIGSIKGGTTLIQSPALTIKPGSDSSAAFQIQNSTASNTLLSADTNLNKVIIGDASGTNANTTQLVVDTSTADPTTGYNGGIYYNSSNNVFRCYQNNLWANCLAASGNGLITYTAGLANVGASQTGLAIQNFSISGAAAISTTVGVATFTAPAGGSFRACQLTGDANTTAGTIGLRWRVNGASVGSAACQISTNPNRTASTALDDGVVTFSQGDTIGIAFDTSAGFLPVSTDFIIYWSVEYNSVNTAPSGATLQSAYDNSPTITTTDGHNLTINAADTTTDANLLFNLQCTTACGANGRFAVQNNGSDVFTVSPNSGNITVAPAGTGNFVVTGDNDSNLQVNSTISSDVSQNASAITLTDNAAGSTGTLYGLSISNADNGANVGVPDALAYLKNANAADTVPDGLLVEQTGAGTLTNGIEVKQTAGTISNGLTFTGAFGSVLKVGATTVINASGQIPTSQLTGNISFANVGAATNTNALVIGTGGSLGVSGTGTIGATSLSANYVASVANGTGITGGAAGSNAAALSLGIDQTAGLTWTGNETFSPSGTNNVIFNGDNDSNVQINNTFSGTGPTQNGLAISLTDNATAAGTSYGLKVINNDNGANAGVPAALAYLANANAAETVTDGLLVEQTGGGTLSNGLEIKRTAGVISNGLTFTGTFTTNLINGGAAFTVTAAGAATVGSNLTVNGTTISLGNGGATTISTPSGGASISIQPNGAGALNLATTNTGNVVVGNGTGSFQLTSNGGLNVTTLGALTGVASIDTITVNATGLTFANAGTVASSGANNLTLQAGSGTVTLGSSTTLTNSGATLTLTSSGGSDAILNNQLALRPGTDASNGLTVQNSAGTSTILSVGTNSSGSVNLISNPSLEANSNGWAKKGNVNDVISSSDDFAQYGSRSLKIVTTANIGDGASYSVPLKASTQYTLSAWIRLAAGTATTVNLNRQDNGADVDACSSGNGIGMSLTTAFTQFTCTFTTGATVNGTTNIYVKQTDGTIRTIYVDGVTLVAAASGLTFDAGGSSLNLQTLNSGITLNGTDSGDVQPWQLSSSPLTTALRYGDSVQANGYIYYAGGCTGACGAGTGVVTVYYAKINADGSLGSWTTASNPLPAARYGLTTFVADGYIFATGGDSGAGVFGANPQTTVYYSKLNGDGSVGTWQTDVNALPLAREFHTSAFTNGFAYVVGGDNAGAQATVYYAKVYADGSTGVWNTTTALTTGAATRRDATTVTANGNIYVIGGDTGGTAQNTVYYNSVNSDGTLGASWASTTAISVGGTQNRRFLSSAVANGYVYAIGGDSGAAAQTTVYYSKLLPDGTIGTWQAASNPLPAARYGATSTIVNGYIYELGGYDGANPQATPYYASTARILLGGSLDLVGLGGGSISASAGAGSITAGSIRAVGGLIVDGSADFNNGITVDSLLNINAVSANAGQTVFNINNLNSNSIFSIRHMSTNFGSLATAGAFVQKDSYFAEEFNIAPSTATQTCSGSVTQTDIGWDRGDAGSHQNAAVTCGTNASPGAGDFNFSTKLGNATAANNNCNAAYQTSTVNGVERLSAVSTANNAADSAICFEGLSATQTTTNKIYAVANLPVMTMKVKMSSLAAGNNNTRAYIGMSDKDSSATNTSGMPSNGAFFSNCSVYSTTTPTGCSNTSWFGIVAAGGAQIGATLTCSTGSGSITANFSYLRVEVRATNDIHFYADYNTTDGINETECGSGNGTSAAAMAATAPFFQTAVPSNIAQTVSMDVDYLRSWQDDNVPPPADAPATAPNGDQIQSAPPLTPVSTNDAPADSPRQGDLVAGDPFNTLPDFQAASNEDTTFEHNVYVKGTLYADKVVANQIEGLQVITDEIDSLQDQLAGKTKATPATGKNTGVTPSSLNGSNVNFNNLQAVNLTVLTQIIAKGGMTVVGNAEFDGLVNFIGQVAYNSDAGGTAMIHKGDKRVDVKFSKPYKYMPIITANYLFADPDTSVDLQMSQDLTDGGYSFIVTRTTVKGFSILLNKAADEDVKFTWLANQVNNPQLSQSLQASTPVVVPAPPPASPTNTSGQ